MRKDEERQESTDWLERLGSVLAVVAGLSSLIFFTEVLYWIIMSAGVVVAMFTASFLLSWIQDRQESLKMRLPQVYRMAFEESSLNPEREGVH